MEGPDRVNHGGTENTERRSVDIYVLSWERYETLALCLAGLCGYNSGVGRIHVLDDCSSDPRIADLVDRYMRAGLIASVTRSPRPSGIGVQRRRMFERFLAGGADYLVQVEGDMLLAPAAIAQLLAAYQHIARSGAGIAWLATHQHDWCHTTILRRKIGPYDIGLASSGSEPFWISDRATIAANIDLLPASRPDMVLYLKALTATVLYGPEIQVQHLGAINSHYYPQWTPDMVTYTNADGSMRQPYPWFDLDFTLDRKRYGALYLHFAELLRGHCPGPLPNAMES